MEDWAEADAAVSRPTEALMQLPTSTGRWFPAALWGQPAASGHTAGILCLQAAVESSAAASSSTPQGEGHSLALKGALKLALTRASLRRLKHLLLGRIFPTK